MFLISTEDPVSTLHVFLCVILLNVNDPVNAHSVAGGAIKFGTCIDEGRVEARAAYAQRS